MFITTLIFVQLAVYLIMTTLERQYPAQHRPKQQGFYAVSAMLLLMATLWAQVMFYGYLTLPAIGPVLSASPLIEGVLFYLVYSLVNYWAHRIKHRWSVAWKYLHAMHHAPTHMESLIAFYRHPLEMVVNAIVLFVLGKLLLDVSVEAVALALVIEGCLEAFHHSNIRTPRWLKPLGYLVQLPEQHLVHHQQGLHRYNYSPLTLWDTVFGTVQFPMGRSIKLGFKHSYRAWPYLTFKK